MIKIICEVSYVGLFVDWNLHYAKKLLRLHGLGLNTDLYAKFPLGGPCVQPMILLNSPSLINRFEVKSKKERREC